RTLCSFPAGEKTEEDLWAFSGGCFSVGHRKGSASEHRPPTEFLGEPSDLSFDRGGDRLSVGDDGRGRRDRDDPSYGDNGGHVPASGAGHIASCHGPCQHQRGLDPLQARQCSSRSRTWPCCWGGGRWLSGGNGSQSASRHIPETHFFRGSRLAGAEVY